MGGVITRNGKLPRKVKQRAPRPARVFGYLVAIGVNLLILWIVSHLLEWGWFDFLTAEFNDVLPFIRLQILATVVACAVYVVFDPRWFKAFGEVATGAFGLAAALAMWRVFPFDFDADLWTTIARIAIGVGIVGTIIGMLANLVKGIRELAA